MTARDGDDRLGSDGNNDARASSGADGRDGRDDMGGYIGRDGYVLGRAGYPMRTLDTGRHFRRPQPAAVGRDGSDGNNDARASSGADGSDGRDGRYMGRDGDMGREVCDVRDGLGGYNGREGYNMGREICDGRDAMGRDGRLGSDGTHGSDGPYLSRKLPWKHGLYGERRMLPKGPQYMGSDARPTSSPPPGRIPPVCRQAELAAQALVRQPGPHLPTGPHYRGSDARPTSSPPPGRLPPFLLPASKWVPRKRPRGPGA